MNDTLTGADLLRELSSLVVREARLLDTEQHEDWLALLAPDVECLIPLGASTQPGAHELAIIREDRFKTEARVWRAQQTGINHSQDPPSRVVRAVSNVEVEPTGSAEEWVVHFVTVLHEYRPGGQRLRDPMNTVPMRCEYVVRRADDRLLIARRQLNLLQRDGTLPPMTFVL